MGPPIRATDGRADSAYSITTAAAYCTRERTYVNRELFGGDRDVSAGGLRGLQCVLGAEHQQLGRLLAVPARDARGSGLPARRGRAHAVEHLDRLAEPAARQDQGELDPVQARQHVDLAQLGTPAGGGLLDQPVALALATQHVERAHVI